MTTASTPIVQFGTGRFLLAHAALFVSEALARGEALGGIAMVQTTASPDSAARAAALAAGTGYPVRIRGLVGGQVVDEERRGTAIARTLHTDRDWVALRRIVATEAQVILSNTGERGYALDPADGPGCLAPEAAAPRSFPSKLVVLLHDRWRERPDDPLSVLPCELVSRNGDRLGGLVVAIATAWGLPEAAIAFLRDQVGWGNSLVDRIVSEPIHPVGAVAEPYALWAIEEQPGLVLPCRHAAVVPTDDLGPYERLKLRLLNLGHSYLAERWMAAGSPAGLTVLAAMQTPAMREALEAVWREEVLPVFAAAGEGEPAIAYVEAVRDRFLNPFLAHRLEDIAQNHAEKKRNRMGPVLADAARLTPGLPQPRLRAALGGDGHV